MERTPGKRQSRSEARRGGAEGVLDGRIFPSPAPMKTPRKGRFSLEQIKNRIRDVSYTIEEGSAPVHKGVFKK